MALVVLLLFNGLVLYFVEVLMAGFFVRLDNTGLILCGLLDFAIVTGLAFLFYSPLGQWYLRFLSGARRAIDREVRLLQPVITQVQAAIQTRQGLQPLAVHLLVTDDPTPDAFAIGRNTLVVSRALYETANEQELAGVIAHELAHLHQGDSNQLGIALGVSFVTLTLAWLAGIVVAFLQGLSSALGGDKEGIGVFVSLFSLFFLVFAGFFLLFVWMGNGLLNLALLFIGRKQEYRADAFAVQAGFGAGLLSYLEKVKDLEWMSKSTLINKLYATHPPIMLRIGEIEKNNNGYLSVM